MADINYSCTPARTQYTRIGHCDTGKCIYWKFVVEAEFSKLKYVED